MRERALVLSPHTDDGEFGCGATVSRLLGEGWEVHYAAFSTCERSVPEGFPPDTLAREVREATAVLGVPADHVRVYGYDVREFPASRQPILEDLVVLRRELNPTLVFLPSASDVHQDHEVIHREGVRAFKDRRVLAYELPWNNLAFRPVWLSEISEGQLETKVRALECYRSQQGRAYAAPDFLRGLARVRGTQMGRPLAEAFEVVRWVDPLSGGKRGQG